MNNTESIESGSTRKGGFLRGLLLAILIIVLLMVLLTGLTIFLTAPSRKQLNRLENSSRADRSQSTTSLIENSGAVMEIPEEELTEILRSSAEDTLVGNPELEFLGIDVLLEDETINILAGASGRLPRLSMRRKVVVETAARILMTEDGRLSINPQRMKIGRLPLPIGRLFTLSGRIPGNKETLRELEASGITLLPAERRLIVDPAPLFAEVLPGMGIRHIRAVRGSLRIALDIPESIIEGLDEIVRAIAVGREDLMAELEEALPAADAGTLEEINSFLATVQESPSEDTELATVVVSYLEGIVDGLLPGEADEIPLDFGDRLPVGSKVSCGANSYAELALPGGHVTKVGENSILVIEGVAAEEKETSLALLSGKARVLVSALSSGEEFYLSAQDAVMAVRGTDYVVKIPRKSSVKLAVLSGRVDVNDTVSAKAMQSVDIEKGIPGNPMPLEADLLDEIEMEMGIRTLPEDFRNLSRQSVSSVGVPHILQAAAIWAELEENTQWDVQHVIEAHMASHPEIREAVDNFFRTNGIESRRPEFETMFE